MTGRMRRGLCHGVLPGAREQYQQHCRQIIEAICQHPCEHSHSTVRCSASSRVTGSR